MDAAEILNRLNDLLDYCRNVPFYKHKDTAGLDPLQSLAEFRKIPVTRRTDLLNNYPEGLVAVPGVELDRYYESAGVAGRPVSVWLTREDWEADAAAFSGWGVGFGTTDIVMVRFPYSISGVAPTITAAAQQWGACVVPAGCRSAVSPFPRVVNLLRKLQVTVLVCLPHEALLIATAAELMGLTPGRDFPDLRAVCVSGEVLAPGRRQTVADLWGVPVFDGYYATEIGTAAVDCPYQRLHPLTERYYFEILRADLITPVAPGETGYLVITPLQRRGMPLLRYLTEDRARAVPGRCACGAAVTLEIRGRTTDVIHCGNRTFDLWDVQEIATRLDAGRFWVAAPGAAGIDLLVETEHACAPDGPQFEPVRRAPLGKIQEIPINVREVPPGTLYDREALLSVGVVGKPQYLYSAAEMAAAEYRKSIRM